MSSNGSWSNCLFGRRDTLRFQPICCPSQDEPKTIAIPIALSILLFWCPDSNDYAIFICIAFQFDLNKMDNYLADARLSWSTFEPHAYGLIWQDPHLQIRSKISFLLGFGCMNTFPTCLNSNYNITLWMKTLY